MTDRREFAIAAALIIAWIVVINVLAACGPRPVPMPPERAAEIVTPWCVPLVWEVEGIDIDWTVCAATERACRQLQSTASTRSASMYGARSVGECSRAEEEP